MTLCPVRAAISISCRTQERLQVRLEESIGVYLYPTLGRRYISGKVFNERLKTALLRAHPNRAHYLRLHPERISSHSLRVTADVCLYMMNVPLSTIAFRLRWKEEYVSHYIRETIANVAQLTMATFAGAAML